MHQNTRISYKNGERVMDDFACIMVANLLDIDPLEVIVAANMEREIGQERRDFLQDFRMKIGVRTIAGLMVLTMLANPSQNTEKAPQGV